MAQKKSELRALKVVDNFEQGKYNLEDFIGALSVNCWELGKFNHHPRTIFTQTIIDELKKRGFHCDFDKHVFCVSIKDLQHYSNEKFNLELDDGELRDAIKGIESGLGNCLSDVVHYAVQGALEESGRIRR